jgi:hypothetical protein
MNLRNIHLRITLALVQQSGRIKRLGRTLRAALEEAGVQVLGSAQILDRKALAPALQSAVVRMQCEGCAVDFEVVYNRKTGYHSVNQLQVYP